MAIAFRAASAQIAGAGSSMTVAEPAGAASGDLLVSLFYYEPGGGTPVVAPDGWMGVGSVWNAALYFVLVHALIRGSVAPDLTFKGPGAPYHEIQTFAFTGVDPYYPIDNIGAIGATGPSAAHASDSSAVTPVSANCWAINVAANFAGVVPATFPTGYTLRSNAAAGDAWLATKPLSTAGVSEDPGAWGSDTGDWWDGFVFTIRPVTGNPNPLAGLTRVPRGFKRLRRLGKMAA